MDATLNPVGFFNLTHKQNWSHSIAPVVSEDGTVANVGEADSVGGYHSVFMKLRYGYAVGVTFKAPRSGKVKLSYAVGGNALTKTVLYRGVNNFAYNSADDTFTSGDATPLAGVSDEFTYEADVKAGDLVYLMIGAPKDWIENRDDGNGGKTKDSCYFTMSSVEYLSYSNEISASLLGYGMAAADTPQVKYIVKYDNLPTNVDVTATVGGTTVEVTSERFVGKNEKTGEVYTEADNVYSYSVPVAAKQMTDDVVLTIKSGEKDLLGATDTTYTVETYCLAQIEIAKKVDATVDEKNVGKVCASMLLYGYMAQQRHGYHTDHMPTIDKDYITGILPD